ncbi:MAG TPA: hypothetical protein VF773_19395 [Verrucomicrobiae bacterium]
MSNEHPMPTLAAKGRRLLAINIAVALIGLALLLFFGSLKYGADTIPALLWFVAAGFLSTLWRGKVLARWILAVLLCFVLLALGTTVVTTEFDPLMALLFLFSAALFVVAALLPSVSAFLTFQRNVNYPPTAAKGRTRLRLALVLAFTGAATIPIVELFYHRFHPRLIICFALFVGTLWAIWRGHQWARWLVAILLGFIIVYATPMLLPDLHEPIAVGILLQLAVAVAFLTFSKSVSLFISGQHETGTK